MKIKIEDKYSNKNIIQLLRSVAAAYLLKGENRFKIIAYEKAAETISRLDRELKNIWQENKLNQVPGIGPSIGAHLSEYFKKGESKHFNEVLKDIPDTVFELMKVPGVGPKKAFKLVQELKLTDKKTLVSDLKKASLKGIVAKIPTFGETSQKDLLDAIKTYEKRKIKEERMPLPYAFSIAERIVNYLKKNQKIKRIDVLGSLRRYVATIGDIDIAVVANSKDTKDVIDYFINYPNKISVDNAGQKKASIIVPPYVRVDLRVQDRETYGSMLQYFTGSKSHNIKLRDYALSKGYSLSEYGIKPHSVPNKSGLRRGKENLYTFKDEKSFYNFVGLDYIPPEIREGTNEIELAVKHSLPKLIELKDIKGDFHLHSSYDIKPSHDPGLNSYEEMAGKAMELGYNHIGFSDHNPSLSGNNKDQIIAIMKKRKEYIEKIFSAKKYGNIKYFIGLEADILPNGKLALPEEAHQYVDYLIAGIHSSFRVDTHTMTNRVIEALKYPKVRIFAHPTGRLLSKREGYGLEWDKIFDFCQKNNKALEINAWPERLDLPDVLVKEALKKKIKFFINTDSHAVHQMDNMFFGVEVARRGWLTKSDIINTMDYNEVKKWLSNRKAGDNK